MLSIRKALTVNVTKYLTNDYFKWIRFISSFSVIERKQNYKKERNDQRNGSHNKAFSTSISAFVGLLGGIAIARKENKDLEGKESISQKTLHHKQEIISLEDAITGAKSILQRTKLLSNCPGISVTVTIDGKEVWSHGFGFADVENQVPCTPATVMRIASISKSLTMSVIAKLWEDKKIDLDVPIEKYVPTWPEKKFNGQKVTITTRQLVSMLAGIRHYDKTCGKKLEDKKAAEKNSQKDKKDKRKDGGEFGNKEYYLKKHFGSVTESLNIFKTDELCSLPGTKYLYSTYGWTLLSAVVEGASGKKFPEIMRDFFKQLGLENTYLDENKPLIYNRARYYVVSKKGKLRNAEYVDNSYKWAGGGFLSTPSDLCRFGNAMLYSYQRKPNAHETSPAGYLKAETMEMVWSPVSNTECMWDSDGFYAMGWGSIPEKEQFGRLQRKYFSHTGGAVGGSSVLLVLPRDENKSGNPGLKSNPRGVVVAIITNMQSVGMNRDALNIAKLFERTILE